MCHDPVPEIILVSILKTGHCFGLHIYLVFVLRRHTRNRFTGYILYGRMPDIHRLHSLGGK